MDAIGPLQLRVMHYIWKHGACTVHTVHEALNEEAGAQRLAYTTILTVMRNLARREILSQKPKGRSHLFEPLVDERTYKLSQLRQMREDLFEGDAMRMVQLLSEDTAIEPDVRLTLQQTADERTAY